MGTPQCVLVAVVVGTALQPRQQCELLSGLHWPGSKASAQGPLVETGQGDVR